MKIKFVEQKDESLPLDINQIEVPQSVRNFVKERWREARDVDGEMEAFRILEDMVRNIGYCSADPVAVSKFTVSDVTFKKLNDDN